MKGIIRKSFIIFVCFCLTLVFSCNSQNLSLKEIINFKTHNIETVSNQKLSCFANTLYYLDYISQSTSDTFLTFSPKKLNSKITIDWYLFILPIKNPQNIDSILLSDLNYFDLSQIRKICLNDKYLVILSNDKIEVYNIQNNFHHIKSLNTSDLNNNKFTDCSIIGDNLFLYRYFMIKRNDSPDICIFKYNILSEESKLCLKYPINRDYAIQSFSMISNSQYIDFNEDEEVIIGNPIYNEVKLIDLRKENEIDFEIFDENNEERISILREADIKYTLFNTYSDLEIVLNAQTEMNSLNKIFIENAYIYVFYFIYDSGYKQQRMAYRIFFKESDKWKQIINEILYPVDSAIILDYNNFPKRFFSSSPVLTNNEFVISIVNNVPLSIFGMPYNNAMEILFSPISGEQLKKRSILIYQVLK